MNLTNKLVAVVLGFLGIKAFAKDDAGKSVLSSTQEEQLKNKFGEQFVTAFKADLLNLEKNGKTAESYVTQALTEEMEADRMKLAELQKRNEALEEKIKKFDALIEKLEKDPADSKGKEEKGEGEATMVKKPFAIDMSLKHNRFLADAILGKMEAAYSTDGNIDTSELRAEFGKYVSSEKLEIMQSLFGTTDSIKEMSTIMTDKTEYRSSQGHVPHVLQQFTPKWTPSSGTKFTPLTIKNFKCKINVPIVPSDIMDQVLGFMYDEGQTSLQNMYVVKYIIEQMIKPKLAEDRETALALGRFKESDDTAATQTPETSMDGYLTQLVDLYNANDTKVNWLQKGVLDTLGSTTTDEQIRVSIDKAVQEVTTLYKDIVMTVKIDPDLLIRYQRAYREKYPNTKNADGNVLKIDFSNFSFVPMKGMRGTGCYFITPKENFKHLMSRDPSSMSLRIQEQDYTVKVFGEYWEGTGFLMKEAIFAYISATFANTHKAPTTPEEGA